MTAHTEWYLTCDACGKCYKDPSCDEYTVRGETPEEVRDMAADDGWVEAQQPGKDICADCLETEKLLC